MVELKAAIGDPGLSVESLAGSLDAAFEIPTLETLAANLSASPEVSLADAEVRARHARVDLAKAERIPDVRVELLYRRLEASKQNAFDVGLSIPLPLFDRNQGRLREARGEVAAAEARSRSAQNTLSLRLHEAHLQLSTALWRRFSNAVALIVQAKLARRPRFG
jgi:cobalt-zinc-cadmium efflux system outer membrane protein